MARPQCNHSKCVRTMVTAAYSLTVLPCAWCVAWLPRASDRVREWLNIFASGPRTRPCHMNCLRVRRCFGSNVHHFTVRVLAAPLTRAGSALPASHGQHSIHTIIALVRQSLWYIAGLLKLCLPTGSSVSIPSMATAAWLRRTLHYRWFQPAAVSRTFVRYSHQD